MLQLVYMYKMNTLNIYKIFLLELMYLKKITRARLLYNVLKY
jgi:hypothetical protein